jgi:hypothetical protein
MTLQTGLNVMKKRNAKIIQAGIKLNRVIVIQSLESLEVQTGCLIRDHIEYKLESNQMGLSIEFMTCESRTEFLAILHQLESDAIARDSIPLVHVECHGDSIQGLEFANASTLSWLDLADALKRLNIATRFNLLTVFSACFGGHFLGQMGCASEPAPCWGLVAPTDTVDPGEILAALRSFYSVLIETKDVGAAIQKISLTKLSAGRWFGQTAEEWFEKLVSGYVREQCTKDAARLRAKKLQLEILQSGKHVSMGSLKRQLKTRNRATLLDDYFNNYFVTDMIPENIPRFNHARERMQTEFEDLRRTNKYII